MKDLMFLLKIFFMVCLLAQPISTEGEKLCTLKQDRDYKILEELILLRNEVSAAYRKIKSLKTEVDVLKNDQKEAAGDTYIRWGRMTCPDNETSLLYTGFMAGSNRNHPGTGSNYLCLTDTPLWDQYKNGQIDSYGRITGVEYQFTNHKPGAAEFFGGNMLNHNAPCAVCHTQSRVSVMIPGRNKCYNGWKMEYSGYLVTGSFSDKSATQYVCLDKRPEKVFNGNANHDDNMLFLVEGSCGGSLACPPYVAGREITCVVCSL